jgi:hypothetical protein
MSVPRRTRMAVLAAAASGALVVTMTGTALAADRPDRPNCSDIGLQDARAALDAVAPAERIRLENLCELIPVVRSGGTEEADDGAPDTTPAAAPEEDSTDTAGDDDNADDADDDGVACEDRFDTENQQVAVHPKGGVATGGAARS